MIDQYYFLFTYILAIIHHITNSMMCLFNSMCYHHTVSLYDGRTEGRLDGWINKPKQG